MGIFISLRFVHSATANIFLLNHNWHSAAYVDFCGKLRYHTDVKVQPVDANRIITHLYKLRAIALPKNHVETKEDQGEPCGMS